jgi:hypothetical protein
VAEDQLSPRDPAGAQDEASERQRRWSIGDVVLIAFMYFCAFGIGVFIAALIAKLAGQQPMQVVAMPQVLLVLQLIAYFIAFLCARVIVSLKTREPFLQSIEWNYPGPERLPQLLLLGLIAAVSVNLISRMVPIPKDLPVEKLFITRAGALASMFFGVLVAPLAEEVFFRGLFYGTISFALEEERSRHRVGFALLALGATAVVLALRGNGSAYALLAPVLLVFGLLLFPFRSDRAPLIDRDRQILIAVVLTSTLFAFIHGAQLSYSWGPMLVILFVGLLLTAVRVQMKSVAASWVLHVGYNATLFLMMYAGTDGFRRLAP